MGGNDIWVSTRHHPWADWGEPVNLGPAVNSAAAESRPSLSWDMSTLYFGSTRVGGQSDIYVTVRQALAPADVLASPSEAGASGIPHASASSR